jgi:hypothetical protein
MKEWNNSRHASRVSLASNCQVLVPNACQLQESSHTTHGQTQRLRHPRCKSRSNLGLSDLSIVSPELPDYHPGEILRPFSAEVLIPWDVCMPLSFALSALSLLRRYILLVLAMIYRSPSPSSPNPEDRLFSLSITPTSLVTRHKSFHLPI